MRENNSRTSEDLSQPRIYLFFLLIRIFRGDGMLKDSSVDLIQTLLWCCDSATTAAENRLQSF